MDRRTVNYDAISRIVFDERYAVPLDQTAPLVFGECPPGADGAAGPGDAMAIAYLIAMLESICTRERAALGRTLRLVSADGQALRKLTGGHAAALVLACEYLRGGDDSDPRMCCAMRSRRRQSGVAIKGDRGIGRRTRHPGANIFPRRNSLPLDAGSYRRVPTRPPNPCLPLSTASANAQARDDESRRCADVRRDSRHPRSPMPFSPIRKPDAGHEKRGDERPPAAVAGSFLVQYTLKLSRYRPTY
jgi:hypothetical protein